MELSNQHKLNKHIFRLLKVNEIVIPIGRTNKGNLGIKYQENSDDFEIYLDAVPLRTTNILEDENNIELKKMLEKYLFEQQSNFFTFNAKPSFANGDVTIMGNIINSTKKRGCPAGSKNKAKDLPKEN